MRKEADLVVAMTVHNGDSWSSCGQRPFVARYATGICPLIERWAPETQQ